MSDKYYTRKEIDYKFAGVKIARCADTCVPYQNGVCNITWRDEKFFVLSDCDSPFQMVFDRTIAFTIGAKYVDSFGPTGTHIQSYKLIDEEKKTYTTDF